MGYYESVYSKVDYRVWLFAVPLIGILLAPFALNVQLGIDFTGGTEIQLLTEKQVSAGQLQSALSQCASDLRINLQSFSGHTTAIIKSKQEITKECSDTALASIGFSQNELESILPSTFKPELGKVLLQQGINIFIIAGILMALVIFVAFRSIIPSVAVIQAAVLDITIGLGLLSIFGFELSLAGFAALLMVIGYSVDDNVVLTSSVLKEKGKPLGQQVNQAFATGITMTGTTIAALSSVAIVSAVVQIDTIMQISTILLTCLIVDFVTTWFTNVAVLQWYFGRPKSQKKRIKFNLFRS